MTRFGRAVGFARSLAVYHAIPFRQRRLRRLYASFVATGDLAFDVGAHAGNRTRTLVSLGCRVVAVEPQPDFARVLRTLFAASPAVDVLEAALWDRVGRASLALSDRTPTVATLEEEWRTARAREPDFESVRWNRRLEVETTTLDALIASYGVPAFIKIDVEGGEPRVLQGLSQPVRSVSFEYLPRALDEVERCVTRLSALGPYRFNWSPGETYRFITEEWRSGEELLADLRTVEGRRRSGDVYARLLAT